MKHIFTTIALLFAAVAIQAQPKVEWLETRHDFGAFSEDFGPATTKFKFVNTGSEPVQILSAHASCGCTTPVYPRDPIAPGDTAAITVTYDPAGRPGRFTKYVGVDMSGDIPKVKLYVSGTVVGNLRSIAGRFPVKADSALSLARPAVMFGPVNKGELRTYNLQGYNRSNDSIAPQVKGLPRYMKVDVVPPVVPPGEQMTFIIYLNTASCPLYGLVDENIRISADPKGEPYTLPLTALVEEDFTKLTPKQLENSGVATLYDKSIDFGRYERGSKLTGSVVLRNTGKGALAIRRVYSSDPGVSAKINKTSLKPGKDATITVTVDTSKNPGDLLNARVAVITNDPANPTQIIRLLGR